MKHIQNDWRKIGLSSQLMSVIILTMLSLTVSSCTAITGIFQAGMNFGIYMVLAVLVIIAFIILRLRKR